MLKIKEVANLVGISVRTLHHYDEIGLLSPDEVTESGYRLYSQNNIDDLQHILFYRELDVPLKKIKEIMSRPDFDQVEALQRHQQMLEERRNQIDQMIVTIERTLRFKKGEIQMSNKEKFKGFDFTGWNEHEDEARKHWGDEVVDDAAANVKGKEKELGDEMNRIYRELATVRQVDPGSKKAQELIGEWYRFLNQIGTYSLDAFSGLGDMYVADERFTQNIDQFGDGLAIFMRDAMKEYAAQNKK
ncbi:MerR family transcriptional regulator [Alkalicoccobacillus murimartini]|uniref:DNA-binding transcriptional MerR regulator n=1 Tax=Alkalicoccobacillus murimartini TaxID=171685 RepID=A0ABT9YLR4_9BACI|nr:MerR family transcriptional regulator [Alkalicoccobacillus murimartini]MDQ0208821.1 DNA-binding transcriptional MerR regulator [Alkalicoccobacillus murimartini]